MAPGETRKVSVAIDPKASHHPMSVWNEKAHAWIMPRGNILFGLVHPHRCVI
jgi:beta-glucosidase